METNPVTHCRRGHTDIFSDNVQVSLSQAHRPLDLAVTANGEQRTGEHPH